MRENAIELNQILPCQLITDPINLRAPMSTTVDIPSCSWLMYNQLLKIKYAFNLETLDICWDLNFTKNTNFQSLEVVDRGSETQLQVAENLNLLAQCSKCSAVLLVYVCLVDVALIIISIFVIATDF